MNHPLQQSSIPSQPRSIPLPSMEEKYTELLGGSPETVSMRSGCVMLMPGESVGLHSTGDNEEMVVTLSGSGELCRPGMDSLPLHCGCVLYNPPHTPHDVVNTGEQPLRYIFIVAKA
ncbi:MAG TPA: cupin domain-containing protein [Anaerolineales bacterium]